MQTQNYVPLEIASTQKGSYGLREQLKVLN
jgi:hypothetical protein